MIILISSDGYNVGKSSLAKYLSQNVFKDSCIKSFADPLKEVCEEEYKKDYPLNTDSFKKSYSQRNLKDSLIPQTNKTYREYLIDISDLYKSIYGIHYFTNMSIQDCRDTLEKIIIFDDFRMDFEYEKCIEIGRVLTIRLSKANSSKNYNRYENLLEGFKFDVDFVFDDCYSNFFNLIEEIQDKFYGKTINYK